MWFSEYSGKFRHIVTAASDFQQSKPCISVLILAVIGLHALPVLQGVVGKKQTSWPIMSWTMYRGSYSSDRPIQATIRRTVAITLTGQEFNIEAAFSKPKRSLLNLFPREPTDDSAGLGLGYFSFDRFFLQPMWEGHFSPAVGLAERLNRGREVPIVAFRLESTIYTVTDGTISKEFGPTRTYRIVE